MGPRSFLPLPSNLLTCNLHFAFSGLTLELYAFVADVDRIMRVSPVGATTITCTLLRGRKRAAPVRCRTRLHDSIGPGACPVARADPLQSRFYYCLRILKPVGEMGPLQVVPLQPASL